MLALTTTTVAWILLVVLAGGWVVYGLFNIFSGRREVGSEIELAANRKPYYDDETMEGPRLERTQLLGVLFLAVLAIGLPVYWVFEPGRQAGAREDWDRRFAGFGSRLFETTANGGFNCAGCHGGMTAGGGAAPYTLTDPNTGAVEAVQWTAPALNTVFYRYSEDEVRFILVYGRPFSPMSPWGLAGGGPMNDQQIQTIIEYLKSIQVEPVNCDASQTRNFAPTNDPAVCTGGHIPDDVAQRIEERARQAVADGEYASYGEALFNMDIQAGQYSCARCHTKGWSWGDPQTAGGGAFGWNLTGGSTVRQFPNVDDMIAFIKNPPKLGSRYGTQGQSSGRMPAFQSVYTDEQIAAIVEYVRSL
jgi:mono/diheme cytochrome c family protein